MEFESVRGGSRIRGKAESGKQKAEIVLGLRLPTELAELAQRMTDSNDPAEKKRLRKEIHRGFYGA